MNHHIDDIFKRKLEKASLDGHLDDWSNARTLLNLDRPKRRIFFWLWLGLGLLLIGGTYIILSNSNSIFTKEEISTHEKTITDPNPSTASPAFTELITPTQIVQTAEVKQETRIAALSELKATTELNENSRNGNSIDEVMAFKSENSNSLGAQGEEHYDGKIETENLANNKPFSEQNNDLQQEDSKALIREEQAHENVFENLDGERVASNLANVLNQDSDLDHENDIVEMAQFELLTKLNIVRLEGDMSKPNLPLIVELDEDLKQPFDLTIGIYAGIDPIHTKLSGGLLLNHNFNAHWSINMGIGVRRYSNEKMRAYSAFGMRSMQNAEVTSSNSYQTVSLDLPVRFSFHANRHSFFVGGILERPFSLNGTQEVTYLEEEDVAVDVTAFDPGFAPAAPQVVTAVQNYSLNAVPEQKRFLYYGQFGYGYDVTERFQISGSAAYRINSRPSVSPLLNTDQLGLNDSSSWMFELRLSYLFK